MAWLSDVNNLVAGANDRTGAMMWRLKNLLVSAGWTVRGSGDGRGVGGVFENVEDATAGTGAGAGGAYDVLSVDPATETFNAVDKPTSFANTESWFRMRAPTGTLEFVVKRSNNSFNQFDYSIAWAADGFVDVGVAGVSTPPSGASAEWINGSTDFATYASLTNSSSADDRYCHVVASDSAIDGVYPFYCTYLSIGSVVRGGFWFAGVSQPSVGDPQPWITCAGGGTEPFEYNQDLTSETASAAPYGWFDYGGAGQAWGQLAACYYRTFNSVAVFPRLNLPQPDGDLRHLPIPHANGTNGRWKGINNLAYWKASSRAFPDTFDLGGANPRVVVGDLVLPWEGGTVPLP